MSSLTQRAVAETLGTAFLLATVIGSGIMAQRLAGGNDALALLCNTLPTGAILTVLILIFGPVSGAHFNPAVSLGFALRGDLAWSTASIYLAAQVSGAIVGVWAPPILCLSCQCGSFLPTFGLVRAKGSPKQQRRSDCCSPSSAACLRAGCRGLCRRPLYYGSLLVHRLNIVRKSCGDSSACPV
jgi:hypothetical protein